MQMEPIRRCRAGSPALRLLIVLAALGAGPATIPAFAQSASGQAAPGQATLPGGAQSLNEAFEDWQVSCTTAQGGKRCAASQQQTDRKTGQRLLLIELQPKGSGAEGVLVTPFGLALEKGVTLKAGETDLGPALRFSTCLPQGCIVPLTLDAKALALVRKAPILAVGAVAIGGQAAAFPISLKGFVPALDRAAALLK